MIKKKKLCVGCDEEQYIWKNDKGNKYCQICWNKIKYKDMKPKIRTKINPKSKKQIQLDNIYLKLRKIFLTKHPNCQASLSNCTRQAIDVHHKSLRGENYLKVDTWLSTCRNCHTWIHENPKEARELNLLN